MTDTCSECVYAERRIANVGGHVPRAVWDLYGLMHKNPDRMCPRTRRFGYLSMIKCVLDAIMSQFVSVRRSIISFVILRVMAAQAGWPRVTATVCNCTRLNAGCAKYERHLENNAWRTLRFATLAVPRCKRSVESWT